MRRRHAQAEIEDRGTSVRAAGHAQALTCEGAAPVREDARRCGGGVRRGERAHRTAYASLKHDFEKVGDHWEEKAEPGPSGPRSKKSTAAKRRGERETYGGVDAEGNTKAELYERARKLGIDGRSKLTEAELARAIGKHQIARRVPAEDLAAGHTSGVRHRF